VAFWVQTHTGYRWRVDAGDLGVHGIGFGLLLLLCVGLSQALARWTGAGLWAWRTAVLLAVAVLLVTALGALFSEPVRPQFVLALVVLAIAAGLSAVRRALFDVAVLSAVALGLDTLLVAGLGRWLFDTRRHGGEPILELFLIGGAAALLLALSVQQVMRLARRHGALA
jgi:zinc transporter ZupT